MKNTLSLSQINGVDSFFAFLKINDINLILCVKENAAFKADSNYLNLKILLINFIFR